MKSAIAAYVSAVINFLKNKILNLMGQFHFYLLQTKRVKLFLNQKGCGVA